MAGMNDTVDAVVKSQGSTDARTYILTTAIVALGFVLWRTWTSQSMDPREPPLIHPKIPFLGHVIGLAKDQAHYLGVLSKKLQLPVFQINVLGGRLYIVSSPELTQDIFRHSKTFSFDPIAGYGAKNMVALDQRQTDILSAPIHGQEGLYPLTNVVNKAMHNVLAPGPNSEVLTMNQRALKRFAQSLDPIDEGGITVSLKHWLSEEFTIATSVGLYGVDTPIEKDRSLVQHLHNYEESLGLLILNKYPSITAAKGHKARQLYTTAFQKYYRDGSDSKTSGLITARRNTLVGGGYNTDDVGQIDIAIMLAASMNSNPALFWLVSLIYSDPELLQVIREEVSSAVRVSGDEACIDVSQLLKDCPVLVSSWQEMLRIRAATISSRTVMEDTLLDGKYLLKKDGIIQVMCETMHTSPQIWGSDALRFDARRFLKSVQDNLSKEQRKQRRDGYTPFGGGASLCPGRHFVTMELLGAVATLVLGYDITKQDETPLKPLPEKKQSFGVQVKLVVGDVGVKIARRKEWVGKRWTYDVGNGDTAGAEGLAFASAVGHEGPPK